ncbi:hypothetical protein SAMN05444159_0793 [Bradyrhizobium lablabi]|uniref:Uncharacterized protein n=1 Tax=Bradyrhizobium lablabi TaxID=722472 RepID=A0A1M6JVW1_9BRAD|nr:hypothetical protein [Bradyrhizobium lablabi]SHJ50831.1 hypothetical protein SAMN05444159_0793 [Bradyrhizobium lablabi]
MNEEEPTEADITELEELRIELTENYYGAIGKGISAWSRTESGLVVIAALLLDTKQEKAGLILYSIANFHSWLAIIDELFEMDPRYRALRPDWTVIANRLKKLNDTRVRLAHHALESGKGIEAIVAGEDIEMLLPSLKPSKYDTRTKSKKHSPLQIEQLADFVDELAVVSKGLGELLKRMAPIFLEPKKKLVERVRELRRMAGVVEPEVESTAEKFLKHIDMLNVVGTRDGEHRDQSDGK